MNIDIDEIDNIDDIEINEELEVDKRIIDFINKAKNPYVFNINGYIVKFSYSDSDIDLDTCVIESIKRNYMND